MSKNILFYIGGAAIGLLMMVYVIYLLNFLLQKMSAISGTDALKTPEIASFNLEKFGEIKKAQ